MRIGVITDEINQDLGRALVVARELGCEAVELNNVEERNIVEWQGEEAQHIERELERAGLPVAVIATPCFKPCLLEETPVGRVAQDGAVREHLALLERGCEWARRLGAPWVRIFSFRRGGMVGAGNPSPRLPGGGEIPGQVLEKIVEGLRLAAEVAARWDTTLVIENVRSCWGNGGANTAHILEAVGEERIRGLWDPANAYVSGEEDLLAGQAAMAPWTVHVHAKDARVEETASGLTAWEAMGKGQVNWQGLLQALVEQGYSGVISLETHWRLPGGTAEESTRVSMQGLRRLLSSGDESL